jgi:hypothetical protein
LPKQRCCRWPMPTSRPRRGIRGGLQG